MRREQAEDIVHESVDPTWWGSYHQIIHFVGSWWDAVVGRASWLEGILRANLRWALKIQQCRDNHYFPFVQIKISEQSWKPKLRPMIFVPIKLKSSQPSKDGSSWNSTQLCQEESESRKYFFNNFMSSPSTFNKLYKSP